MVKLYLYLHSLMYVFLAQIKHRDNFTFKRGLLNATIRDTGILQQGSLRITSEATREVTNVILISN
jgi:hypothetical protein